MTENRKIIAIAGPTASGKSDLAMMIAKRFDGEIVCCDSMQIYREMNIGTAKPTEEDRREIPHHMTDFLDPDVKYSCADYAKDARRCVEDILGRGKLPVVCGGTGLYLDSLLFDRPYEESTEAGSIREEMAAFADEHGPHGLWLRLNEVDPESAARIHENNVRRVCRALEIFYSTGRKKSELDALPAKPFFNACVFVLHTKDRDVQNRRIEKRTDLMIEAGLLDETEKLLAKGIFDGNSTAAQAIGYKEMLGYLRGEMTLCEAREKLIIATRQYAKRQDTWFGNMKYGTKIELEEDRTAAFGLAIGKAEAFLGIN